MAPHDQITRPFRTGVRFYRLDVRGKQVDTAHVIAFNQDEDVVLYNVESERGDRFRHCVATAHDFMARWHAPESATALADALRKAA